VTLTEPIWIDCAAVGDIGSLAQIAAHASGRHHIVLRFPSLRADEKADLIARLAAALPDHSVFDSGRGLCPVWLTVLPVVSRAQARAHCAEVSRAIAEFRATATALVRQYLTGTLAPDWRTIKHGSHSRFENARTGQVVEAPDRPGVDSEWLDPAFFVEFVQTTAGLESVAALVEHDVHDGARILEVMAEDGLICRSWLPWIDDWQPQLAAHGPHGMEGPAGAIGDF
jgi:hypothetical protein